MALEYQDYTLLQDCNIRGGRCALLGDCHYHFQPVHIGQTGDKMTHAHLARAFDFTGVDTFDMQGHVTVPCDLTQPIDTRYHGQYDCVVDAGTLFWCFDVPAVLANIHALLKPGGVVVHISAGTGFWGRGYYIIQPKLFYDYYSANGYNPRLCGVRDRKRYFWQSRRPWVNSPPDAFYLVRDKGQYHLSTQKPLRRPVRTPNDMLLCYVAQKGAHQSTVAPKLEAV